MSGGLEEFYKVFPWPEDYEAYRARVSEAQRLFEELLERHEWLQHLRGLEEPRILDAMGGTGVAGVALAKALQAKGRARRAVVDILDARRSALEKAVEYAERLGASGLEITPLQGRVEELAAGARCPYHAIVVYGLSTPHLDPYQMVATAAGIAACLEEEGAALVEEADRIETICRRRGYQDILLEHADEERIVVTYHAGHNPRRGTYKRLVVDHATGQRATAELRLWDIAGTAAILWAFLEEVDLYQTGPTRGIIIARRPRRRLSPEGYREPPRIAKG